MDLHTVESVSQPRSPAQIPGWREGDAPLAGGTWLFSEPQDGLRRLVDLAGLGWDGLAAAPAGLTIGATCTLGRLAAFEAPDGWRAAALFPPCCNALVGSFKVLAVATVGGNLCLALPAAPMAALAVALDGVCTLWSAAGERQVAAGNFITGPRATVLRPGELLRRVDLPAAALVRRAAYRRLSLTPLGRSGALLIGTVGECFALTITGSTRVPMRLDFPAVPSAAELSQALAAVPEQAIYDDVHGRPAWRRHVTGLLAEEIRAELEPQWT